MWDFKLGAVISTLWQTKSFLMFRFLVYMAITLAYVIGTAGGGGVGYLIGSVGGNNEAGVFYGMVGGFSLVSGVMYFFREYLLYMVKTGHIACIIKIMDGEKLPEGKGQIAYAQDVVKSRFKEASVLFALDQIVKGILKTFNRIFFSIASFLPIPGGLVKFINGVINMSVTYVDELMLAYNIRNNEDNPWEGSRKALVLYAQNYKTFLKNALFLTILTWVFSLIVLLIVFAPMAGLMAIVGYEGSFWPLVIALVTAWGLKSALIDPLAMTALMQVYFKVIEGQEPNPEWDAKLDRASKKFGELKNRASSWVRDKMSRGDKDKTDSLPKPE